MTVTFIRTVILYVLIIFAVRMTGKRQIGQLSPAELVVTLLMSELAVLPMEDMQKPLVSGMLPILVLVALEFIVSLITLKSLKLRNFLNGRPTPVIENGVLNQENMRRIKLSLDELSEELRIQGAFDMETVAEAVMETNGQLSVLLKEKYQPFSADNTSDTPETREVPVILISDGKLIEKGLIKSGVTRDEIEKRLNDDGISSVRQVFYMTVKAKNDFNIIKRSE